MATLESIAKTLDKIEIDMVIMQSELQSVKRGVYGDPTNKVSGLIDTDLSQHQRIKKLETVKNKFIWGGAGMIIVIELLILLFKK